MVWFSRKLGMKKRKYKGSDQSTKEFEQAEKLLEDTSRLVRAAQYRKAFQVAKDGLAKIPRNRFAQYNYAVLLGDSEEWASKAQHKINSRKAARILKSLLGRCRGVDSSWAGRWKNEYYWFSKQPRKQWKLGLERVRHRNYSGYYSAGVAAVTLSFGLYRSGRIRSARSWAERARLAWESYFRHQPDYYNAYVWYGQSLGLMGDLDGMERSLKRAAALSKRKITYGEFEKARKEVLEVFRSRKRHQSAK
jgi:hypothetical protein